MKSWQAVTALKTGILTSFNSPASGLCRNGVKHTGIGFGRPPAHRDFLPIVIVFILCTMGLPASAQQNIDLFPTTLYDRYTAYSMLAFFWIAIIGLIVIIRMKLREARRLRDLEIDRKEKDVPFLD